MIYDLVSPDHSLLKTKLEKFDFSQPPINPIELVNNLIETMVHYKGIGLSANQVGLPYRVFVLHSAEPLAMFNPIIVDVTAEEVKLDEGCLSYPNLFLPIKRPKIIKVRFQDPFGEFHTEKYIGMTARCIQHELDHLNGIDYTKRANPIHLARAMNQKKILDRKVKKLKQIGQAI
jgi:peptide deformylase